MAFTASRAGADLTTAVTFFSSGQTAAPEERLSFHQTRPPIKITAIGTIAITAIRPELRSPLAVVRAAGSDTPGDDRTGSNIVKFCTPDKPGTLPRINEVTTTDLKSAGMSLDNEEVTAVANICGSLDTTKPAVMAATADEKFTLVLTATNGPDSA